jgi:hypothetical protein
MTTITAELAYRLRHDRGLMLPPNGNYSNLRLKEIAIREAELIDELSKLDKELEFLKLFEKDNGDKEKRNIS